MSDFSLDELARNLGQRTGNFALDTANLAANFTCSLYKNYPAAIISNPADSYLRGLWDTLCNGRPAGLPNPPAPPFNGGQCPVLYDLQIFLTYPNDPSQNNTQTVRVWGPVGGIRTFDAGGNSFQIQIFCRGRYTDTPAAGQYWRVVINVGGTTAIGVYGTIQAALRVDGQPDNCGSLPPQYSGPTQIPTGQDRTTTNYTFNDGTTVSIPLIYAPITGKIGVDVGGVKFSFDYGGANTSADMTDELEDIKRQLADMQDSIADINAEMHNLPYADMPIDGTSSDSGTVDGLTGLAYVRVKVTQISREGDMQYGVNGPNVIYAGWFEFRRDGESFPRQPMDFKEGVFIAPKGANGYAYTFKVGYAGYTTPVQYQEDSNNG